MILKKNKFGRYIDVNNQEINCKGYLIDHLGNVIDKHSRIIFYKHQLEDDEIPKLFSFTRFTERYTKGKYELDPMDCLILTKDDEGNYLDLEQKLVNSKGYILDKDGDVYNKYNKLMFKKKLIDHEDYIPLVFRTRVLLRDPSSSLSEISVVSNKDVKMRKRKIKRRWRWVRRY